jgi:flagellar motor protein MotB
MKPEKIVRIVGAAATDKLETAKSSDDPANRRISIVVLTDEAFNKMQDE